jgi:hypothetical protein
MSVRAPFVLAVTGTSLSTGRLSADWVPTLERELRVVPECKGPLRGILNMGHGGWTSADILANAPLISALKPTHILFEGGAINDCVDTGAGPAISRGQHIANIIAMIAEWRARTPNSILTLQTMSSVSASMTIRPNLADFYADEIATAAAQSVAYIDHFPFWPNPLNAALTYPDPITTVPDGLHPIFVGAVDTYSYPATKTWARAQMAAFWP